MTDTTVRDILDAYRKDGRTNREMGTYFERFVAAFLKHDPIQATQYQDVCTFAEWAASQGQDARDLGIDLVAKLAGGEGYAAIQCKFYDSEHKVSKRDIDSFVSASGREPFRRRVIVDTSQLAWSENAETMLRDQALTTIRIGLDDLEQSPLLWKHFLGRDEIAFRKRKELRLHQKQAIAAVTAGLAKADRGKLIMACGTGKTYTSMKIAEKLAGKGKNVLVLVPSLALMAQSVREWTYDSSLPLRSFAVCSDTQVGKRRKFRDDVAEQDILDLAFPATTDAGKLAAEVLQQEPGEMTVVFATYQSIQVIAQAQEDDDFPVFDLIICDEAHRTTGATLAGDDESNFVKVHDNKVIRGKLRLYMTATPRIYGDQVKTKAKEVDAVLASMDDDALYGKTLFYQGFSKSVQENLLTDYKVIVLAIDEGTVSAAVQKRLGDASGELVLDDATKIIGCYKALAKTDFKQDVSTDKQPMRRAIAFCRDIKTSQLICNEFESVINEYLAHEPQAQLDLQDQLRCEIHHVDGTQNTKERGVHISWLEDTDTQGNVCRILTNARCLSEGVDVPALDAIMFLHPRKSQIDVVQAVGRVMRLAEGKKMGYVVLPVGVPAGVAPEKALADNEKYRVVWQILNALRAHDDRFDATINKASLGQDVSDNIEIIGISGSQAKELESVTAVAETLPTGPKPLKPDLGKGGSEPSEEPPSDRKAEQGELSISVDEFSRAIMAKIVKKCGTRDYWEDWAGNIADIAKNHISRLTGILKKPSTGVRGAFDGFVKELRDDLNDSVTEGDAIEMLAQHTITRPVFDVLFEGHKFTSENPVSKAMQQVLDILHEAHLEKESKDLDKFYASVRLRADGITDPNAKQKLVVELYDKFFRRAFPLTTQKLGIVYTPVEIVDFIIHSVNDVLRDEFGQTLGSKGVHIIDPFTGTGTFITRLLQSGLIEKSEMEHKYRYEIHANEIVLLAYYIAAINIESVYHSLMGGRYLPFEGICLTDTFQMNEKEDLVSKYLPDNSERRKRQQNQDIRIIMGNPPYSIGQRSANDDNANVSYTSLDGRIRDTYAARSTAASKKPLYDSYIRALRWGSDRIGEAGVMAYVSNAGWIDSASANGLRNCLKQEFSSLYVFHLLGNARTSGEQRRKEKDNVFGEGSRAPIAISVFVKNPKSNGHGKIYFHDIGDYLKRDAKLKIIDGFKSISGISKANIWRVIVPDQYSDWVNQRDPTFDVLIKMGDKREHSASTLFDSYSLGVGTNRDAWCTNPSLSELNRNITRSIDFFNSEVDRLQETHELSPSKIEISKFIRKDAKKISWSRHLRKELSKLRFMREADGQYVTIMYRPYSKQWLYFGRNMNEVVSKIPDYYPDNRAKNMLIDTSGMGCAEFSALMINAVPDLETLHHGQCFPLRVYDTDANPLSDSALIASSALPQTCAVRDGVSDAGLEHFLSAYHEEAITKEDIFYYVYGIFHSEDYRTKFASNLAKELPRIPRVRSASDFWAFSKAGRKLGDLHVNYESADPFAVEVQKSNLLAGATTDEESLYRVTQMQFGRKRAADEKYDKTTVVYNSNITMRGIPLEAYDYVVNGKPALEWVMQRQSVKVDKASGIVNDANRYAIETVGDPAYPLKLFQRVITVSLETMKIVRDLPKLDVMD